MEQPQPAEREEHDAEAEEQRPEEAEPDVAPELLERDEGLLLDVGDHQLAELGDQLRERRAVPAIAAAAAVSGGGDGRGATVEAPEAGGGGVGGGVATPARGGEAGAEAAWEAGAAARIGGGAGVAAEAWASVAGRPCRRLVGSRSGQNPSALLIRVGDCRRRRTRCKERRLMGAGFGTSSSAVGAFG